MVRRQRRGVDHHVGRSRTGAICSRSSHDAVHHRAVGRQRMRPARSRCSGAARSRCRNRERAGAPSRSGRGAAAEAAHQSSDRSRRCGCRRRTRAAPPSRPGFRRSSASGRRAVAAARCRPRRSRCPPAHSGRWPRPAPRHAGHQDERAARGCAGRWTCTRSAGCRAWLAAARSCGGDSRQGKAQLRSSRCLERRQASAAARLRARDLASRTRAGARLRSGGRDRPAARPAPASAVIAATARCRRRAPRSGPASAAGAVAIRRRPPRRPSWVWSSATSRAAGLDQPQRQVRLARSRTARAAARAPLAPMRRATAVA